MPQTVYLLSLRQSSKFIFRIFCVSRDDSFLGPEVIKLFSCSTLLNMKFFLLLNVKMPTIVGILTFISRKNSILGLSESEKAEFLDIFILMDI